jgi:hypothetical protein
MLTSELMAIVPTHANKFMTYLFPLVLRDNQRSTTAIVRTVKTALPSP